MSDKVKIPVCRITSLRGFGGVIIGTDLGGILTEGHVYSATRMMGEIILTDLGKHAVEEGHQSQSGVMTATVGSYLMSGATRMTEDEFINQKK